MEKEVARKGNEYRDMVGLRDTISGLFDDFFSGRPMLASRHMLADSGLGWTPAVNIREMDDAFLVYAALPGVERSDVNLEVKDNTLTLTGQAKESEETEDGWLRRELPAGQFYRAFNLASEVDSGKVSANFKNGILEIRLPKAEQSKPRKVQIT